MTTSIDDHLRAQDRDRLSFLAALEAVPEDSELVRVIPYLDGRCLCTTALRLRKDDLEIEPTPITAACCNHRLRIVRVRLKPAAAIPVGDFVAHIAGLQGAQSSDGRHAATTCDCEALWLMLASLQEELHEAAPGRKPAIIKQIAKTNARIDSCGC